MPLQTPAKSNVITRVVTSWRTWLAVIATVAVVSCGGSGLSGTYEADMGGGGIRVTFQGGNKAKVGLFGPDGQEMSHNCTYTQDGTKLHFTTTEAAGAPMDLVYKDGVLSDGQGLIFKKK